jgi:hypothetical protein
MGRAEVSWKKKTEEGEKREVYVKHLGKQWLFFEREKRYDEWQAVPEPSLEDWLELLDGVRRRIGRRLLKPEEEERVLQLIRLQYPEAEI